MMSDGLRKMYRILPIFTIVFLLFLTTRAQPIASFLIHTPYPSSGIAIPVSIDLDSLTSLPDTILQLWFRSYVDEVVPVPFQVDTIAGRRFIHWMISARGGRSATYILEKMMRTEQYHFSPIMHASTRNGSVNLSAQSRPLLSYVFSTAYPPSGVDTAYKKSGFIHPLYTPHGQILTRIQPTDHYHHYGIWDPWTHVLFKADTIDCWNLAARKGTQRFAKFTSITSGSVFAQFRALQQHVAFHKDNSEEVFLNEHLTARIYGSYAHTHEYIPDTNFYILDLTIQLTPATPYPVTLLTYRYGGLGWRATAEWNRDNSEVLTSDGMDRRHADGTTARWCIIQGKLGNDYGGIAMLSHPDNFNHPEPLRIWPDTSNGRGDLFANFSPTKDRDWRLEPGHPYTLRYRWIVFNGHFTKQQAESAWHYFAHPPLVTFRK